MTIITVLAVLAMVLIDLFGPQSSVGGPMMLMLISFIIMLAVGIYESWSKRRGPLGWIINIVAALVGGFLAISLAGVILDAVLIKIHFQGSLASSNGPLRYIATIAVALFTVLGAWLPIKIIDRFR